MSIRVLHVGLGPIGAAVALQIAARPGLRIVGAVDIDPAKVGRDAGEVIDLGRRLRVTVSGDLDAEIRRSAPDVAVVCTSSTLGGVVPQFEALLRRRVPIVTTTEEAAYPAWYNKRLTRLIDAAACKAGVAVLGTGVNPGFTMDALPIALTAVCERVDSIEVRRVQDARIRRLPFQQKIGAGLTREEFRRKVADRTVRHVGFSESIQMIADAMGWQLGRIVEQVRPKVAERAVTGGLVPVAKGRVSGVNQRAVGYVDGTPRITLTLEAYLGAPESYDSVLIEGSPRIHSKIEGGVHGDIATASMTVNSIAAVIEASPGFRTMRDMRLPSFFSGNET
jgi:4-hydroxy-tetrahydrodipicolinate reductase